MNHSIYVPDPVSDLLEVEALAAPVQPGVRRMTPGAWVARSVTQAVTAPGTVAGVLLDALEAAGAPMTREALHDALRARMPEVDDAAGTVDKVLHALMLRSPTWEPRVQMLTGPGGTLFGLVKR